MISPCNNYSTWRNSHFLKPSFLPSSNSPFLPNPIKTHFSNFQKISSKVNFQGWKSPLKHWGSWVESLRPRFEPHWRKTSIDEAIKASTLDIPRHYDLIFSLAQRFCPDTNTFVFPWGEASMTLEDVMVLGGYSVTGESVLGSYNCKELCEIEDSLHSVRMEITRSKAKKASHCKWAEKWMGKGVEFEHEAFLSLWLSRFVFPSESVGTVVNKRVFPIAVLLAKGTKIALAPAVLARMYGDLRCLKEKMESLGDGNDEDMTKLNLCSPLLLLQFWVWERFPVLSPEPNPITPGQPRVARWNKFSIGKRDDVGLGLDCAKQCFVWRPYTKPLNNWSYCVRIYPEKECWVVVGSNVDLDLESYVRLIRVSELVGLDCIEQYLPHRVSMQFGFDQDVPMVIPRLNSDHETAWSNYNRPVRDGKLYVPSKMFESDVTLEYFQWWKKLTIVKVESGSIERVGVKLENNEVDVPSGFACPSKMAIENVCSYRSSSKRQWDNDNNNNKPSSKMETCEDFGARIKSNEVNATPGSSPQMEGVEVDDDSDCDHLTLTQLVHHELSKRRGGDINVNHFESPLSSAGENVTIQEVKSSTSHNISIRKSESARKGSSKKDEIESKTRGMDKEGVKTSLQAPKCEKRDLLARIYRVQRIVNMVKASKLRERKKIQH